MEAERLTAEPQPACESGCLPGSQSAAPVPKLFLVQPVVSSPHDASKTKLALCRVSPAVSFRALGHVMSGVGRPWSFPRVCSLALCVFTEGLPYAGQLLGKNSSLWLLGLTVSFHRECHHLKDSPNPHPCHTLPPTGCPNYQTFSDFQCTTKPSVTSNALPNLQ